MQNKSYNLIGLATKAGKVITGSELCEKAIKTGKSKLVIISEEASELTKKSFTDLCKYKNVQYVIFGTKSELGKYTGKEERTVVVILDYGFAKKIKELIDII